MKEYIINEREIIILKIIVRLFISLLILANMYDYELVILLLLMMAFI